MATPAMYPALSEADALRALAGMTGEIVEALPSAITYGSLPAEAVAVDRSCNNRESSSTVDMRLTAQLTFWWNVTFHLCWQHFEANWENAHDGAINQHLELLKQAVAMDIVK
jgi:hypothetical protein